MKALFAIIGLMAAALPAFAHYGLFDVGGNPGELARSARTF